MNEKRVHVHRKASLLGLALVAVAGWSGVVGDSGTVRAAPAAGGTNEEPEAAEDTPDSSAPSPVSYARDVRPILQLRCQGCHQPAKAGGKVIVTSHADLVGGRRGGEPIAVAGKPDESVLVEEITPDGGDPPSMPKDAEALSAAEIELIRRWIAEGARDDSPETTRVIYSAENPPAYRTLPVVTSLDFSPDGQYLAVSGVHEVLLHKADGSDLVARLIGLAERVESVVFSPDGEYLAVTGGFPGVVGDVQIWNVQKRKLVVSVPMTYDTVYGASWSHDGKLVAFGCGDNTVRAIDAGTGKQVLFQGAHNDWVLGTAFSKDSSHLVSVSRDMSMKLIVVETEQFVDNITSITPGALKGGLVAVDRHPSEDQVLAAGSDGEPKIYRIYREKARKIGDDFNLIRKFEPLPGRVFSAEFSDDAMRIVAGSSHDQSGEVRVYQVADGKKLWSVKSGSAIYAVAFSPDGAVVAAGGFDGKVRLIDAVTGETIREFVPVPLSASL